MASVLADIDLVTDWVYFYEVSVRKNVEIPKSVAITHVLSCFLGFCSWVVASSDGRILSWTGRFVYWPIIAALKCFLFVLRIVFFLPTFIANYLDKDLAKTMRRPIECIDLHMRETIEDHFKDGTILPRQRLLANSVYLEDIPQIIFVLILDIMDSKKIQISTGALVNLMITLFNIFLRLSEIYDIYKEKKATRDKELQVDYEDAMICTIRGHKRSVNALCLVGENRLVSTSFDNTVKLWNVSSKKVVRSFAGHKSYINDVCALGRDRKRIVTASDDGFARIFDVKSGDLLESIPHDGNKVSCVAASPRGEFFLTGCYDEKIRMWHSETYEPLGTYRSKVWDMCFLDDDRFVTVAYGSKVAKLWVTDEELPVRLFNDHDGSINAVTRFSKENFLTASSDDTIKMWRADEGWCVKTFEGHTGAVLGVAKASGKIFVSVSADKSSKLWDVTKGSCIYTYTGEKVDASDPIAKMSVFLRLESRLRFRVVRLSVSLTHTHPLRSCSFLNVSTYRPPLYLRSSRRSQRLRQRCGLSTRSPVDPHSVVR